MNTENQQYSLDFEAPTIPSEKFPDLEEVQCHYCEDVGPCMYCSRGRKVTAEIKKQGKK